MKTPMELLKAFAPEFAKNQMDKKALLFEHPDYQSVPAKYKLLISVAAAAIAGSETCTEVWATMAEEQRATNAEIVETMMTAQYMKRATVNGHSKRLTALALAPTREQSMKLILRAR